MGGLLTPQQSNVAKLRSMGLTHAEIAESLELTPASVKSIIHAICARHEDANRIAMAREVELSRLEELHEAYFEPALNLNKDAATVVLNIHEKKVKLLNLTPEKPVAVGQQVNFNLNFGGTPSAEAAEVAASAVIDGELAE